MRENHYKLRMYRLIKRLLSVTLVLVGIALILNLKIGGKPARDHAADIWGNESVQKVYHTVRDRVLALIRKDISVEEVFKPEAVKAPSAPVETKTAKAPADAVQAVPEAAKSETKTINMEKLDDADRQALEKILEKSSQ